MVYSFQGKDHDGNGTNDLDELQAALTAAQQSTATEGRFAAAYQLLFDMITEQDTNGEDVPKSGVDPAAWVFIRGVDKVNANDQTSDFNLFIREYSKIQYETRFGEGTVPQGFNSLAAAIQKTSDDIAENILIDILNQFTPTQNRPANTNNNLPTAEQIATLDAQAAATNLFDPNGIDPSQIAGWAGNPLFLLLGVDTPYRGNILHDATLGGDGNTSDAYDVLSVIDAMLTTAATLGITSTGNLIVDVLTEVLPDTNGSLSTLLDAASDTDTYLENIYGAGVITSTFSNIVLGKADNSAETLDGTTGEDILHGAGGDDTLNGSADDDILDGGDGIDTVDYSALSSNPNYNNLLIDLDGEKTTKFNSALIVDTDVLVDVENVIGSDFKDVIIGDETNNQLFGGLEDDRYFFRENFGNDRVSDADGLGSIEIEEYQEDGITLDLQVLSGIAEHEVGNVWRLDGWHLNLVGSTLLISDPELDGSTITIENFPDDHTEYLGITLEDPSTDDPADTPFASSGQTGGGGAGNASGATFLPGDPNACVHVPGVQGETLYGDGLFDPEIPDGPRADFLSGTGNNDRIIAGALNDFLSGGGGNDTLEAGSGNDVAYGGGGDDIITGAETVYGGAGNDQISGGSLIYAGDCNDVILGTSQNAYVNLGGGDLNIATITFGNSQVVGGSAADTVSLQSLEGQRVDLGGGNNWVRKVGGINYSNQQTNGSSLTTGSGDDLVTIDFESMSLGNGDNTANVSTKTLSISSGNGDDTLSGSTLETSINAGGGNDILTGKILSGGSGNDTLSGFQLEGGSGNDSYAPGFFSAISSSIFDASGDSDSINITAFNLNQTEFERRGEDLVIRESNTFRTLTIEGHFTEEHRIESLSFLVGGNLSWQQIEGLAVDGTVAITGSSADETLGGTIEDELFYPQDGDDSVAAAGGNDTIQAGTGGGNDTYDGGDGEDWIIFPSTSQGIVVDLTAGIATGAEIDTDLLSNIEHVEGGSGNDSITGDLNNNTLRGMIGDDTINGLDGNDRLYGNEGSDSLSGGSGDDLFFGGADNDTLLGEAGLDTLNGGTGNDMLEGGNGNDDLNGEDGDDTLSGGESSNDYTGGAGNDRFVIGTTLENDVIDTVHDFTQGEDVMDLTAHGYLLSVDDLDFEDHANGTFIQLLDKIVDIRGIASTALTASDFVFFNPNQAPTAQDDSFTAGEDVAIAGNVLADNGNGVDSDPDGDNLTVIAATFTTTNGGSVILNTDGTFTYTPATGFIGNDSFGYTLEDGNGGSDTGTVNLEIVAGQNITGTNADDTLAGGAGNDTINGSNGNDVMTGNAGNDSLIGFHGHDTLQGNDGADTLDGGNGTDSLGGGSGNDSLIGGNNFDTLNGGEGDDTLDGGNGNDNLQGDDGNDSLTGFHGHDTLLGGNGADTLEGQNGNDSLEGGSGNDHLIGFHGHDTLIGDDGNDTLEAGNGDDSVDGGAGDDLLEGFNNHDTLNGGDGNDSIDAHNGNDIITGGSGADTLTGGFGADQFIYTNLTDSTNINQDLITDFKQGVDKLDFSALGVTDIQTSTTSANVLKYTTSGGETIIEDNTGTLEVLLIGEFTLTSADLII